MQHSSIIRMMHYILGLIIIHYVTQYKPILFAHGEMCLTSSGPCAPYASSQPSPAIPPCSASAAQEPCTWKSHRNVHHTPQKIPHKNTEMCYQLYVFTAHMTSVASQT